MKRDLRLQGLSSEHHQALVIGRRLRGILRWSAEDGADLGKRFDDEIDPHFRVEDEVLLPALRDVGAIALVDRTETDHAYLREQVVRARAGDAEAARAFGERLWSHVRFEERELFPACETMLPSAVLDEVARRAPKVR
jgi:hemerythrin-like domain-containing protein